MGRARIIKPGFFTDDELAEIEPLGRILFAGLWTIADREGRLEYRPKRIKAEILPYDDVDIARLISVLVRKGFLIYYEGIEKFTDESGNKRKQYLKITNFEKHQTVHKNERESELPGPQEDTVKSRNFPSETELIGKNPDENGINPEKNGNAPEKNGLNTSYSTSYSTSTSYKKEIYKEKEKLENNSQEPPPPPDFNLTKKEIDYSTPEKIEEAWFEMIDQEQVKKWGAVKITRMQATMLINPRKQDDIDPGFQSPDVLIAAIRACRPDLDRHYDYLKKIANDPQSVEVYTKKAELEVNPPPEVEKMMEAIIKTNHDTSSS